MSFVNKDAINLAINDTGEKVTIKHYRGDQTYDVNQKPTRPYTTIRTKASISDPTKRDIDTGLGKITIHDKKFMFYGSIELGLGDNIKIDATSEPFEVKQINTPRVSSNKIENAVFASRIQ